jgi:uncharacterized protein YndB with AHSA1/START domain
VAKDIVGERLSVRLARWYPAAPAKVWRAWTDPRALAQWFRPNASFSVPVAEADVRVGGRFRVLMLDGKGEPFDLHGEYREVEPLRKLVMTWNWREKQPGLESLLTVSLRPEGQGTRLELRHEGFVDMPDQPTHEQGWNGALDKLGSTLVVTP